LVDILKKVSTFLFCFFILLFASIGYCGEGENTGETRPPLDAIYESPKIYEFYVLPVEILFAQATMGLNRKVSEHWSIGAEFSYWKITDQPEASSGVLGGHTYAQRYALRFNWLHNGFQKAGFYVSPILGIINSTADGKEADGTSVSFHNTATYGAIIAGYADYDTRFFGAIGLGCATKFSGTYSEIQYTSEVTASAKPPNVIGVVFEGVFGIRF
jgi:hypothetical protein